MRALVLGLPLLLAAALLACTSSQAVDPETLADAAPSVTSTATAAPTETPAPSPTATATPERRLDIVYIGNTAGTGVSLRDGCHTDARVDGAWAEGAAVRIITPGEGACSGWAYVVGPGVGSWVLDIYLEDTKPAVAPPQAPGGPTPRTPPSSGPPAGAPMFLFGSGSPGDLVTVSAAGSYCSFARADVAVGLWALEVGPGTDCNPPIGAALTFTRNGQLAPTAVAHAFTPGANVHVSLLP